jgi:hypothetical protein
VGLAAGAVHCPSRFGHLGLVDVVEPDGADIVVGNEGSVTSLVFFGIEVK